MHSDKKILILRGAKKCSVILDHKGYWMVVAALIVFVFSLLIAVAMPYVNALFSPGQLALNVTDDLQAETKPRDGVSRVRDQLEALAAKSKPKPERYICNSTACGNEGQRVTKSVNASFSPCDDFYQYACANWMAQHQAGPTEAKTSVDDRLLYNYAELMAHTLSQKNAAIPAVKVFFDNCLRPNDSLFGQIRGMFFYLLGFQDWPYLRTSSPRISANDVSMKMGDLHRNLGIDSLFHFELVEEMNGSVSAVVEEPKLLIGTLQGPLREYGFISDAFRSLMASLDKFADTDVAQLELNLAQRKSSSATQDYTLFPRHSFKVDSLPPNKLFYWSTLVERAFGERILENGGHTVKAPSPKYLLSFADAATLPRKSDVLNYLVFRVAMALSPFLKDEALRHKLASVAYADQPQFASLLPESHYCVRLLDRFEPYVPMLLTYSASIKLVGYDTLQELLMKSLNASFYEFFRNDSRFFGAFKESMLRKLAALSWEPLVPHSFFDKAFRDRYLENLYKNNPTTPLNAFFYYWLKNALKRRHWTSSPLYRVFRTGWKGGYLRTVPHLAPPYQHLEIPLPVFDFFMSSHASVQLLHIPRVAPRLYHTLYRLVYYWAYTFYFHTTMTDPVSVLENIRGCLQADYSRLKTPFSNVSLNAEMTSLSDLFDLLAVPAAYQAFLVESLKGFTSFRLAGAQEYTHEQLFFLYYAFGLCEDNNPAFLDKWMSQGSHSAAWYRVNGPLRHFPRFANAFNCTKGTFMNPAKTCLNG